MSPDHAACDRRGSTSTTMSAISGKKIAMIVQRAGPYPFFAASHAVSATRPTQITSKMTNSGNPTALGPLPSLSGSMP